MAKKTNPHSIVPDISDAAYQAPNFNYDGTPVTSNTGAATEWNPSKYTDPNKIGSIPLRDVYTGGRYASTFPGADNENLHGAQQSGWEQAVRGITKGVNLAGTTVLGGFGTTYGIVKAIMPGGKFSDIWDNEIMHGLDEWNKQVDEEWLPNYYTNREKEAKWYETDNWFSTNFLFDKVIKNSGFAVGAMISGNIANTALMGAASRIGNTAYKLSKLADAKKGFQAFSTVLRPTARAFSQGKNIEVAQILERELTGVASLSAKAKQLEQLATTTNKFTQFSNATRRTAVAAYSSAGEANFEALQSAGEYRERLIEEHRARFGSDPTGQDLANIDRKANKVGATAFAGNMALLGVTEWFQLPYLMGSSYRATKAAHSRFVRETGEIAFDEAGKAIVDRAPTAFGRMYKGAMRDVKGLEMPGWSKYILDPKEGMQEIGQYALQIGSQNYYDKAFQTNDADWYVDGVLHGLFGYDEEGEGVGALVSKEGIEGGIIGTLTGGVMQGRQKYRESVTKAANTAEFVEALNNAPTFRDAFKQKLQDANRGLVLQEMQEEAIKQGNVLESKDIEHDLMFNYMFNKIKYGRKDMIHDDISEMMQMGSTKEGLDALKEQGFANSEDTVDTFQERVSNILSYMDKLELMAENVEQVYGSSTVTDPDGNVKPAYSEAALHKLTYAASKIADYDVRIPQLEADLMNNAFIDMTNINDNIRDPKKLKEAETAEQAKIERAVANEEVLPDDGKKAISDLKDYIELKHRKSYFFKEYNDIVTNPAKYEEIDDSSIPTPEVEQITVKTRDGEAEVSIGKEYLLGTVIKYDAKGNKVFRAPGITILQQKEDGTLVIKDANGKVQEITEKDLEDYNLIDPVELKNNKTANWYINHWNEVFTHQSIRMPDTVDANGKKVKGALIEGRIELTKDKTGLNFVYISPQGKLKRVPLQNRHFIADKSKGYTKPLVRSVRELTPAQQQATTELVTAQEAELDVNLVAEKRNKILNELYEDLSKKFKKSEALVKSKKEQLAKVQKQLAELRDKIANAKGDQRLKNKFRFKSETKKALNMAMSLARTERQLQREIQDLQEQQADIEITQLQLLDFVDTLEMYPDRAEDFLESLRADVLDLQIAQTKTIKQINAVSDLMKATKNALNSAVKYVRSLISDFEKKYPNVPRIIGKEFVDYLQNENMFFVFENVPDAASREEAIDRYRQELQYIDEQIEFHTEETIVPNEKRLEDLQEHIDIMVDELKDLEQEINTKEAIIAKFEDAMEGYLKQKAEEAVFKNNTEITKELEDSYDEEGVEIIPEEAGERFEPEAKKEGMDVVGSTTAFSGRVNQLTGEREEPREHHKRANRFGFRFHKLDNKEDIRGVVVNSKTQDSILPGLMKKLIGDSNAVAEEILAFVMVTDTPDGLKLVDEFGEVIEDDADLLDRAIYQVFPQQDENNELTKTYNGERQSMFRETEGNVEALTEKYIAWRDKELAREKLAKPEKLRASFGHPEYDTYLDENGTRKRDYSTKTSAQDAGLIDDDLLVTDQVLVVATTNDAVSNGTVTFNTPLGRVFLRVPGGLAKTQNRKHTAKEAETIFSVLHQVATNIKDAEVAKKGEKKEGSKVPENEQLYKWLKSVVYWGINKTQKGKTKDKGYSSIWFETVEENGQKVPKLMFSKNRTGVTFTPSSLEANKNIILHVIEQMYVNVDATRANQSLDTPYYQITGISNGKPVIKEWANYQSYLLSNKYPDGKARPTDEIPLVTNYKKVTPDDPINRQGVYFTRNSAAEDMYVEPKKKSAPPAAPKPTVQKKNSQGVVTNMPAVGQDPKGPIGVGLDGVQEQVAEIGDEGDTFVYTFDLEKALDKFFEAPFAMDNLMEKLNYVVALMNDGILVPKVGHNLLKKYTDQLGGDKAKAQRKFGITVFNTLKEEIGRAIDARKAGTAQPVAPKPVLDGKADNVVNVEGVGDLFFKVDIEVIKEMLSKEPKDVLSKSKIAFIKKLADAGVIEFTESVGNQINNAAKKLEKSEAFVIMKAIKGVLEIVEPELGLAEVPSDAQVEGVKPEVKPETKPEVNPKEKPEEKPEVKPEAKPEVKPGSFADSIDYTQYDEDEETAMREITAKETEDFKPENWKELEGWLKKNFPNVPVYRVKTMVRNANGKYGWGMLHNGAIYVYENAEIGTAYHEVFEAVWKHFTTVEERQQIIDEFRDREGSYTDRFTGEEIEYSKATPKQLKEEIAEEFRDKRLYGINPKRNKGKSIIERIFNEIIRAIKEFFVGPDAYNNTRKLFEKIESGHYAKYMPYTSALSLAQVGVQDIATARGNTTSEMRMPIKDIPARQQHDIMQHMTYHVLKKIVKNNDNLFSVPSLDKEALYKELHDVIIGKIAGKVGTMAKKIAENPADKERYDVEINNHKILIDQVHEQWESIRAKHEEQLQSYEITFDENDELEVKNYEKDKHDLFGDATKIDQFRKSSYAVRFLLSSLPYTTEDGKLLPSTINGAQLIPSDKVFIDLKNKLYKATNLDDMLSKLGEIAETDPNYANLYTRLLGNTPTKFPDYSNLDEHGWELLSGIWKVMKGQNPDVLTVFIHNDGIQIGDSALAGAAKQARYNTINAIINKIKKGSEYFDYNKKKGRYSASKKIQNVKLNPNAPETYTTFLKHFDIDINPIHLKTRLNDNQREMFFKSVDGILQSMKEVKDVVVLSSTSMDMAGKLLELGTVQAILDNPEFESTYYNINGEKAQTFIGSNPLSNLFDSIGAVDNINKLKGTHFGYLLTDSFSKGSVVLNKIFDIKSGKKRKGTEDILKPVYIDGTVDVVNNKKKQSSKLTYRQRFIQEINLNLGGVFLNLIPGDASLEWGVRMHSADSPFVSEERMSLNKFYDIFKHYFTSEVNLVREDRIVGHKHKNNELRFFRDMLKNSMGKKEFNDLMSDVRGDELTPLEVYDKYSSKINGAVLKLIQSEGKATYEAMLKFGIISINDEGLFNAQELNLGENMDKNTLDLKLQTLAVNYMIANIELHKVLYADPFQYSDELKRIKNFNSPRQPIITMTKKISKALHSVYNNGYKDKNDIGYTDFKRNFFRTITLQDVWHHYNMPGFEAEKQYEEADGAALITMKSFRKYRILASDWSTDNERQYKYDIAWEKKDKGLKLTDTESKLLKEGNPEVKSTYTSAKPIVSGSKDSNRGINDSVLDKMALIPLSYRVLKQINENANAIDLYNRMMEEDIDYAAFVSARKVGVEKAIPVYDANGNLNDTPYEVQEELDTPSMRQTIVNIPYNIVSVQAEVPSKDTHKITRGSQITKLVTLDFMQNGVPIDFMAKEKSFDKRYAAWIKLDDKFSYESSIKGSKNLYTLMNRNQELLDAKTELGYRTLLKEFGIKEVGNTYVLEDKTRLANTLKEEMLKREINDNVSAAFDAFKDGDVLLEATPAYQQIRNILYSIADKRVISPKITGGMKVQVPSTLLESNKIEQVTINGKKGYVSDTLKFYEDEDGKRHCEIMIGRWFDSPKSDEELLNEWYVLDENGNRTSELTEVGKEVLSGVGFRIPTQKQNSIESFVIKKLLPKEFGDNIILPSGIVKKSGSDFDIDKLSIYLKNVLVSNTGSISVVKYLDDSNSTVDERYDRYVKNEVKEYNEIRKEVQRDSIEWNTLQKNINKAYEAFKEKLNKMKEEDIIPFSTELDAIKSMIDDKKDASEEIYSMGEEIFKNLPLGVKATFWDLNAEFNEKIKKGEMKKFEKTLEFRMFAKEWIRDLQSGEEMIVDYEFKGKKVTETIPTTAIYTLDAMIGNYDMFLNSVGFKQETIEEFTDKLQELRENKEAYRENKKLMREGMLGEKSSLKSEFYKEFNDTLADVFGLMSREEFAVQPMDLQNSKQALENEYVDSLQGLISHPLNFDNLVKPNSADQMKELAKQINTALGKGEIDYSSPGNMLSRGFMSSLRQAFVSGKYAIGIAAVNQTNHSLMQRFDSYIDLSVLDSDRIPWEDRRWMGDGKIKFKEYNKVTRGGKVTATLSGIANAAGDYISDIIGMFIDGYVDIAAGPWIMEIGAGPRTASTWLFLIKAGVPIDEITYFMNQPIIREYMQLVENAGYNWLFIEPFRDFMKEKYSGGENVNVGNIPSLGSLKKTIKMSAEDMNDSQKAEQLFMLDEFLKYSKMANQMFLVTQGSNFDTANFNDPFLVFKKFIQLEKARNTIISSVDNVLQNSFVGKLATTLYKMRDAMSTILISDRVADNNLDVGTRDVLEYVLKPFVEVNDRLFLKISRKAVSDLFDWQVQKETGANNPKTITNILLGDDTEASVAKQVMDLKKEAEKPGHPLHRNIVLESIEMDAGANNNKADNLYIKRKDNKAYDQNLVIAAFREMREYLGVQEGGLYGKIVRMAMLQSGLSNSKISFTNLLPYEDFVTEYREPLSKLNSDPNIAAFAKVNVFERNNWNNPDIVPATRELMIPYTDTLTQRPKMFRPQSQTVSKQLKQAMKQNVIPKVVYIGSSMREAQKDIIVYTWDEIPALTQEDRDNGINSLKAKKAWMRKNKDYSYVKRGLMKKVYRTDENGKVTEPLIDLVEGKNGKVYENYVYKAINAWGDGYKAQELYDRLHPLDPTSTVGQQSVFDNGFIKVDEVEDAVIIDAFDSDYMEFNNTSNMSFTAPNKTRIYNGEKTTTIRDWPYNDGVITIKDKKFFIKARQTSKMDINTAGGAEVMVKTEGLPTKADNTNKYPIDVNGITYYAAFEQTQPFFEGSMKKFVYDIIDVTDQIKAMETPKLEGTTAQETQTTPSGVRADSPLVINIWSNEKNGYEELSNFSTKRPYTDSSGRRFATVEAAFQFAKTQFASGNNDKVKKDLLKSTTGPQAKALGSPSKLKGLNVKVWNANAPAIMKKSIKDSFLQNPDQIPLLLSTGDAVFTHMQDNTVWETLFPKIMMEVRNELSLEFKTGEVSPPGLPPINRSNKTC